MTRGMHTAIVLCLAVSAWLGGCGGDGSAAGGSGGRPPAPAGAPDASADALAGGFAVWESNRGGDWRIWTARLDGGDPRQLSRDEPGRQHCCPHVSPDGRWVVYLSRVVAADRYPEQEVAGELRLVALGDRYGGPGGAAAERTLAGSARTYGWGDRAAIWRDPGELIYVGGDGRSRLLDVASGRSRPLTAEPRQELGWLIDATLRHATNAAPSFSLYDAGSAQVAERQPLGGCEPYFSHDGRWGFWIGKGGGPIERMDLASREISTLVTADDPRLPAGRRYVYFPMLSPDGRALAWGASGGQHDHFKADYDVFVAETDPHTLDLLGPPRRITADPATDRYPDVWVPPLPLGDHAGEAPLTVSFPAPGGDGGAAEWDYGDGGGGRAAAGRHTYEEPGVYPVTARRGGEVYRGRVVVETPRPPRAIEAALDVAGRRITVRFDRPVAAEKPRIALESGLPVAGWRLAPDGLALAVELGEEAVGADRLHLAGVAARDGARAPLAAGWIAVEPPPWPADRRRLIFLWQAADRPNLVFDPGVGLERAYPLAPRGRARVNRRGEMVVDGGSFAAPPEAAANVAAAVRSSGELTLVVTVTARTVPLGGPATVVWLGPEAGPADLRIDQEGSGLALRVRPGAGGAEPPSVKLGELAAGEAVHLAVTRAAGRWRVYRDGEESPARVASGDGAGFAAWRGEALVFGDRPAGGADWPGVLSGIAIWSRPLAADEVRADAALLQRSTDAQPTPPPPALRLRATLTARSAIPTLREISPYRQALAVFEYRVDEVLAGADPGPRVRVAQWVILDGEALPLARAPLGERAHPRPRAVRRQPSARRATTSPTPWRARAACRSSTTPGGG